MTTQQQVDLLRRLQAEAIKHCDTLTADVVDDVLDSLDPEETPYERLSYICEYGCASGTVESLIYYDDTCKFYKKHIIEIANILYNSFCCSPSEMFTGKWDDEDPLVVEANNQNLLAWFGYEETAYRLLNELEQAD